MYRVRSETMCPHKSNVSEQLSAMLELRHLNNLKVVVCKGEIIDMQTVPAWEELCSIWAVGRGDTGWKQQGIREKKLFLILRILAMYFSFSTEESSGENCFTHWHLRVPSKRLVGAWTPHCEAHMSASPNLPTRYPMSFSDYSWVVMQGPKTLEEKVKQGRDKPKQAEKKRTQGKHCTESRKLVRKLEDQSKRAISEANRTTSKNRKTKRRKLSKKQHKKFSEGKDVNL